MSDNSLDMNEEEILICTTTETKISKNDDNDKFSIGSSESINVPQSPRKSVVFPDVVLRTKVARPKPNQVLR